MDVIVAQRSGGTTCHTLEWFVVNFTCCEFYLNFTKGGVGKQVACAEQMDEASVSELK